MTSWALIDFQNAASPVMEELLYFHDFVMVILAFITGYVGVIMMLMLVNKWVSKLYLENQVLEGLWTILPALILIQIAAPSLLLLYTLDDTTFNQVSIKSIGHQWYWSYEYSDCLLGYKNLGIDSYMMNPKLSEEGGFRLLDVENRVILPFNQIVQVLTTSGDVLHSWTVPSLGVKADSCPGRLNQVSFISNRPGLFYGQCSEICGANHSFMPICLEMISSKDYVYWISEMAQQ